MVCLTHVGDFNPRSLPRNLSKVDSSENLDQPVVVASPIDHTLSRPDTSEAAITRIGEEAKQYACGSICINPYWVKYAAARLPGPNVETCTVFARAELAHRERAFLKVILEIPLLSRKQKEEACRLAVDTDVDLVKTASGFSGGGATVEGVALMRRMVRNVAPLEQGRSAVANAQGISTGAC